MSFFFYHYIFPNGREENRSVQREIHHLVLCWQTCKALQMNTGERTHLCWPRQRCQTTKSDIISTGALELFRPVVHLSTFVTMHFSHCHCNRTMNGFEACLCEQVCLHRHFMTEHRDSQIGPQGDF